MDKGAYQLFIEIEIDIDIEVGKLGLCHFAKGNYIYTGSAMRNLKARVDRHLRKDKKIKWHIDYLLNNPNVKIISTKLYPSDSKTECSINQSTISHYKAEIPIKKFGSSDCKFCPAHLIKINL